MASNKVILRSSLSSMNRRQPLLWQSKSSRKAITHLGEAVGGTAAVCCCFPGGLANIMYLAIYKVPATLCMRALKKKLLRRRLPSSGEKMFPARKRCTCGCCDDISIRLFPTCEVDDELAGGVSRKNKGEEKEEDKDVVELEKEMWDRFYSTGFWRSSSRRDGYSTNSSFSSMRLVVASTVPAGPNLQVLAV